MDLISREAVKKQLYIKNCEGDLLEEKDLDSLPSAFEGMTNNEVHKAIFGFELDPRYEDSIDKLKKTIETIKGAEFIKREPLEKGEA